MDPRKVYSIAIALSKSQLRTSTSGRVGANLFRRPIIMLLIDLGVFVGSAVVGYLVVVGLQSVYPDGATSQGGQYYTMALRVIEQALVFIPTFVPSGVLLGGLLFELSVSSKFSASDTINWLPVTQSEFVAASAVSVAYNYSVIPALFLGITLLPALAFGYGWVWAAALLLSVLGLFTGGVLVEIVRAGVNRVSSAVTGRTRRGAFALRLLLFVVLIVIIDTSFNPTVLLGIVDSLSASLSVVPFIPILWGSIAVEAGTAGRFLEAAGFSAGTVAFTAVLFWLALKVRSRYWSPMVSSVVPANARYDPKAGLLVRLGLTSSEAAIVRKDFKGIGRRRELIQFFGVPIVIVAVFIIDDFSSGVTSAGPGTSQVFSDLPLFIVGTIFSLMISSFSFGQESKSVMVLYSMPVSPDEILRAKAFVALILSVVAILGILVIFSILGHQDPISIAGSMVIGVAIATEQVFIGLGFGAAHPDFQERPRPRFVDPYWLILMLPVGWIAAFVTGIPVIVRDFLPLSSTGIGPFLLFPAGVVFALVVSYASYRWARRSVRKLMAEYKI